MTNSVPTTKIHLRCHRDDRAEGRPGALMTRQPSDTRSFLKIRSIVDHSAKHSNYRQLLLQSNVSSRKSRDDGSGRTAQRNNEHIMIVQWRI